MGYKKILFIGLGGAGQRHLRVFYDLLPSKTEFYAFRSKKTTPLLNSDFSVKFLYSILFFLPSFLELSIKSR